MSVSNGISEWKNRMSKIELRKKINDSDKYLLPVDLVLLILLVSDQKGIKNLQKKVFLAWRDLFYDVAIDPIFTIRDTLYSDTVDSAIQLLNSKDFIYVIEGDKENVRFSITEKGRNKIRSKLKDMDLSVRYFIIKIMCGMNKQKLG